MAIYQANTGNVVHDTIDGEVLAIRSDTGAYYSMTGSAATAWVALIAGVELADAVAAIAAHHGLAAAAIDAEVTAFAVTLVDEMLLLLGDASVDAGELGKLPPETNDTSWTSPEFEKFTDMQDLLLFDPIHEVQPSGWPHAATPTT